MNYFSCGPDSLHTGFRNLGIRISKRRVRKKAGANYDGTSHKRMIDTARENGFCWVKNNACLEDIEYAWEMGLSVIVNFNDGGIGHYSSAVRVSRENIILRDSRSSEEYRMKKKEFLDNWYDYNYSGRRKYIRWMMVLSDNNFEIRGGKKYRPILDSRQIQG